MKEFTEVELMLIKLILDRIRDLSILEQIFEGDLLDFDLVEEYENVMKKLHEMGV